MPGTGEMRFCLIVETDSGAITLGHVERALAILRPASIVLVPEPGHALDPAVAQPLIALAQAKGAAALIQSDAQSPPGLAQALGADGVHLSWRKDVVSAYSEARGLLGRDFIVGAEAGRSRHDAMTLGELGADYVSFGIPPHVADRETARARRLDLVGWWAEIFEVPVIAFDVGCAAEAAELAALGADFAAIRLPVDKSAADLERWLGDFAATSDRREAVR
jgi:thiamine-phosphate pyrophosphorylase